MPASSNAKHGHDPRSQTVNALPFEEVSGHEKTLRHSQGLPVSMYRTAPAPVGMPTGVGPTTYFGRKPMPAGMKSGQKDRTWRPSTAPLAGPSHSLRFADKDLTPKFIDKDGHWVQDRIPMPIAETQTQPLMATATIKARVPGRRKVFQPVSAVVSYNDVSPLATAEYVRETLLPSGAIRGFTSGSVAPPKVEGMSIHASARPRGTTMLRAAGADGGTYGHYGSYGQYNVDTHRGIPTQDTSYLTGRGFGAHGITVGDYEAAATLRNGGFAGQGGMEESAYGAEYYPSQSEAKYSTRSSGARKYTGKGVAPDGTIAAHFTRATNATNLKLGCTDLERTHEGNLGKHVVAGSPNARLVGGTWRHVPRPVDGDVLWTDYYGPYGKEKASFYGRVYHDASNRIY